MYRKCRLYEGFDAREQELQEEADFECLMREGRSRLDIAIDQYYDRRMERYEDLIPECPSISGIGYYEPGPRVVTVRICGGKRLPSSARLTASRREALEENVSKLLHRLETLYRETCKEMLKMHQQVLDWYTYLGHGDLVSKPVIPAWADIINQGVGPTYGTSSVSRITNAIYFGDIPEDFQAIEKGILDAIEATKPRIRDYTSRYHTMMRYASRIIGRKVCLNMAEYRETQKEFSELLRAGRFDALYGISQRCKTTAFYYDIPNERTLFWLLSALPYIYKAGNNVLPAYIIENFVMFSSQERMLLDFVETKGFPLRLHIKPHPESTNMIQEIETIVEGADKIKEYPIMWQEFIDVCNRKTNRSGWRYCQTDRVLIIREEVANALDAIQTTNSIEFGCMPVPASVLEHVAGVMTESCTYNRTIHLRIGTISPAALPYISATAQLLTNMYSHIHALAINNAIPPDYVKSLPDRMFQHICLAVSLEGECGIDVKLKDGPMSSSIRHIVGTAARKVRIR